jgi:transcriptional regulator with XRE-family HTH domain/anti-sigma regulatory factor (Ser/Thr protein kinase)
MSSEAVISLAERLKRRREELGLNQSQAARQLDVARTAYRLWELEAARPSPDRWRLIARWLGVSVTTMLLAEELMTEEEAAESSVVEFDFGQTARNWDTVGASKAGDFFAQARALLEDGVASGDITADQAGAMGVLFERMSTQSSRAETAAWKAAELRKAFPVDDLAPRHARDAVSVVADAIGREALQTAVLLVSELVTNSVRHGPSAEGSTVGLFVGVGRDHLRVEVSDGSPSGARPKTPSEDGGYGLAIVAELATRWGAGREHGLNVTWFELDLSSPGA